MLVELLELWVLVELLELWVLVELLELWVLVELLMSMWTPALASPEQLSCQLDRRNMCH